MALARTGDLGSAEDLVQDVMTDAHRRWGTIGGYDDGFGWARRAVLNRSISRWRREGSERRALDRLKNRRPRTDTAEPVFADEELWGAIRALPKRQFEVVVLLWFEDMTAAEVAAALECGEETVRTHWRRARARLAEELGEEAGDDR